MLREGGLVVGDKLNREKMQMIAEDLGIEMMTSWNGEPLTDDEIIANVEFSLPGIYEAIVALAKACQG